MLSPSPFAVVENLMSVAVKDYKDIEGRMNEGTKNRTVASTNMNATSRCVSIVTLPYMAGFSRNENLIFNPKAVNGDIV